MGTEPEALAACLDSLRTPRRGAALLRLDSPPPSGFHAARAPLTRCPQTRHRSKPLFPQGNLY